MIDTHKGEGSKQPKRTLMEEANWLYEVAVRRGFKAGWIWYRLIGTYLDTPEVRIAYAIQRDKLLARS